MTLFTAGFIGGVSVLWDKEFGFLKEILVAPASRAYAIIGRALGDSFSTIIQGFIILLAMFMIAPSLNVSGIIPTLLVGFAISLTFNSIGIIIASRMNSMEGFHLVVNLIMWPIIFLSGAFYPVDNFPEWIKPVIYINPLTYGVDASRYFLSGITKISIETDIIALVLTAVITLAIAALIFEKTTIE
jgi:ABC-2 type transport system permease protein